MCMSDWSSDVCSSDLKLPLGGLATVGGRAELRGYPQKKMETAMTIAFPPLPCAQAALAPHISADTLAPHHGKHHTAYVDQVNAAIEGTDLAATSLEAIIHQDRKSVVSGQSVSERVELGGRVHIKNKHKK